MSIEPEITFNARCPEGIVVAFKTHFCQEEYYVSGATLEAAKAEARRLANDPEWQTEARRREAQIGARIRRERTA
jgi:hypothetical protein